MGRVVYVNKNIVYQWKYKYVWSPAKKKMIMTLVLIEDNYMNTV